MSRARRLFAWAALACFATALFAAVGWRLLRVVVGVPEAALAPSDDVGHRVVDRRRVLLRQLRSDHGTRGRSAALADLGDHIVIATIVAEDRRFHTHDGVDGPAMLRAIGQAVEHGRRVSGASTITQQLVKMTTPRREHHARGVFDKLVEMAQAENLEESAPKEEILAAYLDRLSYGRGIVGPELAARYYYRCRARDLSWAQAAVLAVVPRAPTALDPIAHHDRVVLRQRRLLEALSEAGFLSPDERDRAKSENVIASPSPPVFNAPHLSDMLARERRLDSAEETVTTIDGDLQRDLEVMVPAHLASLGIGGPRDAAVLVIDNASGDVLAYVGNADYRDPVAGQVDVASAQRQPGSTLKPFVYAVAFEGGKRATDLMADVPTQFATRNGVYSPSNFDGAFYGPVAARDALATSLNVPAVRLAAWLGPSKLSNDLEPLGLTKNDGRGRQGVALALGSGEVTLRDLAAAYATLARGGLRAELRFTASEPPSGSPRVLGAAACALVTDALSDPLARLGGPAVPAGYGLDFPVAVKTGTSSGYRDAWTVGYTRERTVAVWVGNATGAPMAGVTGARGAGPLFFGVMRRAMTGIRKPAPLWDPDLLERSTVCPLSGKRATADCPHKVVRWVPAKGEGRAEPSEPCDVHLRARNSGATWTCDARADVVGALPDEFAPWLDAQTDAPHDAWGTPLVAARALHGCEGRSGAAETSVDLVEPQDGATYLRDASSTDSTVLVWVRARLPPGDTSEGAEVLVDDREQPSRARCDGTLCEARVAIARGHHTLSVRAPSAMVAKTARARITVR